MPERTLNQFEKDLDRLREKNPLDDEEFCNVLGLSVLSPEGYYVSLAFQWMEEKCRDAHS